MFDITTVDNGDFYYNGHWLSEFGGYIAGQNGVNPYSVIPSKDIKTEKVLGLDGDQFYSANYNPRTFVIPIWFEDLTKIRDIASWLNVKTPTDFYIKGDKLKIQVMIDSAVDIENYNLNGLVELKFISYSVYFNAIDDIKYIFTKFDRGFSQINPLELYNTVGITQYDRYSPSQMELMTTVNQEELIENTQFQLYYDGTVTKNNNVITMKTTSFTNQKIFNDGNCSSFPLIKIVGTGNITVTINNISFTVNNVTDYCYVDSYYYTCYRDSNTNKIVDFSGDFIHLQQGYNTISVTSTETITELNIQCNSRWI